ncbi:MAG TPA: HPr family phosphocarrier protein [Ktedonobacterales bacterium]
MNAEERRVTLTNETGLHARPASLFVQTAARFNATIRVRSGGREANAKSILDVLQVGARNGAELIITAEGADASAAVAALASLVESRFGEGA